MFGIGDSKLYIRGNIISIDHGEMHFSPNADCPDALTKTFLLSKGYSYFLRRIWVHRRFHSKDVLFVRLVRMFVY